MKTLCVAINTRAAAKFNRPVNKDNFEEFIALWFSEAESFKRDLQSESLTESAAAIIEYERRSYERFTV